MAENADFSSLLEEIKENMPELYQEMEAYAQRTGKSLAELSKDEAFVSRYSAVTVKERMPSRRLTMLLTKRLPVPVLKKTAPWPMTTSLPPAAKKRPLLRKRWLPFPILSLEEFTLPYRMSSRRFAQAYDL